ncbi:MAG: hypothetical protein JSS82_16225 [Bacteroidetes bacterium]|nr:hypothetical protein [Bacteroidota bacterium]
MEKLYQTLDDILTFFTTDAKTGLPGEIGNFTCVPLTTGHDHAGYMLVKGGEIHFFPSREACNAFAMLGSKENVDCNYAGNMN